MSHRERKSVAEGGTKETKSALALAETQEEIGKEMGGGGGGGGALDISAASLRGTHFPSLKSLMVSVDVKHHVYLLTGNRSSARCALQLVHT